MILHFSPPSAANGHVELPLNPPPHNLPPSFPTREQLMVLQGTNQTLGGSNHLREITKISTIHCRLVLERKTVFRYVFSLYYYCLSLKGRLFFAMYSVFMINPISISHKYFNWRSKSCGSPYTPLAPGSDFLPNFSRTCVIEQENKSEQQKVWLVCVCVCGNAPQGDGQCRLHKTG